MKYTLIITPRNVVWRLFVGVMLVLGGLNVMMQGQQVIGLAVLLLGAAILLFALRWFWRLFVVAWFR